MAGVRGSEAGRLIYAYRDRVVELITEVALAEIDWYKDGWEFKRTVEVGINTLERKVAEEADHFADRADGVKEEGSE